MKDFALALLALLIAPSSIWAQNEQLVWAKSIYGNYWETAEYLTTDPNNNLYVSGIMDGPTTFDSVSTAVGLLYPLGNRDCFLTKVDPNGQFLWVKQWEHQAIFTNDKMNIASVFVDQQENIYLSGTFEGTIDFDPSSSATYQLTATLQDAFVLKLNANGDFAWAKQLGGSNWDEGRAICADTQGNVYISGVFAGTADFNPDTASSHNLTASGSSWDVFVCQLNSSGDFVWATSFGGQAADEINDMLIYEDQHLYLCGRLSNVTGGPFIQKMDLQGNTVWNKTGQVVGGSGITTCVTLSAHTTGVCAAGRLSSRVDFDPSNAQAIRDGIAQSNTYIWKLDHAGNYVWIEQQKSSLAIDLNAIAMDSLGNVYALGSFRANTNFWYPRSGSAYSTTGNSNGDIYLSKYSINGHFNWLQHISSGLGDFSKDHGLSIDAEGSIYIAGHYQGSVDLDPDTTANLTMTARGNHDIFIQKLSTKSTVGINENSLLSTLKLYPNPAKDWVQLATEAPVDRLLLFDVHGKLVLETMETSFSVADLPSGIYLVQMFSDEHIAHARLIKE